MASPVGLVLGHSFVHSIHSHLKNSSHNSPADIARTLHLHYIISELHMHGIRGARICHTSFSIPHDLLLQSTPDFVILDFGSNDLASGSSPFQVASRLIQLAERLRSQYHVRSIVICSVLHRQAHLRTLSPQQFSAAALQLNSLMKDYAGTDPLTFYHNHKGFWTTPVQAWSRDGVHPNSTLGRKRYSKSLRKASFLALQGLTRS